MQARDAHVQGRQLDWPSSTAMAQILLDLVYSLGNCLNCFPGSPTLKVNSRSFKILRLLGEVRVAEEALPQLFRTLLSLAAGCRALFGSRACPRLPFSLTQTALYSSLSPSEPNTWRPACSAPVLTLSLLVQGGFSYVYLVEDTSTHELFALKKIRCPFGAESVQQAMREVDAYKLFAHVPSIISAVDYSVATERGADDANRTVYILLPYYRRGNLQDMINANLVNHARFPERRLMMLFLGVCKAVRAMHQYRRPVERMEMDGLNGAELTSRTRRQRAQESEGEGEDGEQQRPLMAGENQVEGASGQTKSYAHRDIKPGSSAPPLSDPFSSFSVRDETTSRTSWLTWKNVDFS